MYIDMAGYLPSKLKRKDLEEVNDEFSDFSLSSPARKIRRLDAELPPIMEEEEPEQCMSVVVEENLPSINGEEMATENEERAIILFQPMNMLNLQSPSNYSVLSVRPDVISGIKNHILWPNHYNCVEKEEEEVARKEVENDTKRKCFAMVPWVPSQLAPNAASMAAAAEVSSSELSEAVEMEIEDNVVAGDGSSHGGTSSSEEEGGLHQWQQQQQQHCMFPQFPQNTSSSPLSW